MGHNLFMFSLILFLTVHLPEETIGWRDDLKLTWSDFKGKKNTKSDAVAVTASGITFAYSVKKANATVVDFIPVVEAHFYPNRSWVVQELADDYILIHEQLHFDITELHVRKFRKQLSQVKISNRIDTVLDALHKSINKELATMQTQYDKESNNSINKKEQTKWSVFVANELKKLERFKSKY
ncbi:DUF922 domain-containing protein [Flavobacteriaceae bacterium LMO-SS05]